jgi:rhodanese-related sulfurtransferase
MANKPKNLKKSIYEHIARIGGAVASPRRLEILDLLCQGPRTVEALAKESGQSLANTSQHLRVLRLAQLVESEKNGLFVTCRLADDEVSTFLLSLRRLAESRLAEIERVTRQFLRSRGELEPVDRGELLGRIARGEVTLLDVRPTEEYQAAHFPGAVSIPLRELERRLATLPRKTDVVAYCRGPYCVMALEAVELLRAKGFRAFRLDEGVSDWRARGQPLAVGEEA